MSGKNEIVAGIRLNGEKEFRQEVTSINKSISSMKSELKLVSAEYEGQANSLEALTAKDKVLNKILEEQKRKVEATKRALENARSGYEQKAASVEELRRAMERQQQAVDETNQAYEAASQRLQKMTEHGNSSERAMEKQKAVVGKLEAELEKQNKALEDSNVELRKGETQYQKIGNQVNDWKTKLNTAEAQLISANKAVKENAAYLDEAAKAADGYASSIDKFGKHTEEKQGWGMKEAAITAVTGRGISAAVTVAKAGAQALKEAMMDASSAASQLAASTGLSETEARKYQSVMEQIKGNNFGDSYRDVADVMSQVIQVMGKLGDTEMTNVTESALALRDTFEMDVNESIRAADVMIKTMGVDAGKAFDLIALGAQNGLNRSGELVDNLTEYGALWGQAGFSAEEMFGILENGLDAGAYNLDKVNDFVKEFGISLSDGRIEDNISSFSNGTQKLFGEWQQGRATSSQVFYSIISDLENMTNKQEALTVASNIWSALGEDNAMDVLTALNDTNDAYKNVHGTMKKLKEVKYDNLADSLKNLGNVAQEHILAPIGDVALPLLTKGINAVADGLETALDHPKSQVAGFVEEVRQSQDEIQSLMERAQNIIRDNEIDVSQMEIYKQKILEVNQMEDASGLQKYELKQAVNALAQDIPELASAWDSETESINLSEEAIQSLIDQKIAYKNLTAEQLALEDTYNAKIAAEANKLKIDSSVEDLKKRIEEVEKLNRESADFKDGGLGDHHRELVNLHAEYDKLVKNQKKAGKAAEEATTSYDALEKSLQEMQEAEKKAAQEAKKHSGELETAGEASDKASDASDAYTQSLEGQLKALANSSEAAEAQKAAMDTVLEAYEGARQEIESSLQDKISLFDMFETSDGGEDFTVEKMTENLNSQIDAFREYQQNLEEVKNHVGQEIAPEFMQYLESMGMDGANTLKHILATFGEGETGADKVREMSSKWCEAMDMTEGMAEVGAANKVAYEMAMGGLGSSEADFSGLTDAIDQAVASAAEGWGGLEDETRKALDQTVTAARECGIMIPEGLAEGIAGGEVSPESAIAQLQGSIQGRFQALVAIAGNSGIEIPEEIRKGIEAGGGEATAAFNSLVRLIAQKAPELYSAMAQGASSGELQAAVKQEAEAGASGITDSTGSYMQGGQQMGQAVAEGITSEQGNIQNALSAAVSGEGVSADSGTYEELGRQIAQAIAGGITSQKESIGAALTSVISAESVQVSGFDTVGGKMAQDMAKGVQGKSQAVSGAASAAAQLALSAVGGKMNLFGVAGSSSGALYAGGISGMAGSAHSAAANMAASALGGAGAYTGSFVSVGYNISYGVAAGISGGASAAVSAAASMAASALAAAKRVLAIRSPSRKFRDDVGRQIGKGFAFGIKDSASLASKAASSMSAKVYTKATSWLKKYKKANKVTLDETVWFWQQVQKHTKLGTDARRYAARQEITYSTGSRDIANNILKSFNVSKKDKDGKTKSVQDYYSEVYSAAEKYVKNYQVLNDMSTKQETAYWTNVRRRLKKGTQAWYDATAKINELKEQQAQEAKELLQTQASVQDSILDKYKVYYKVSAKAEMDYWKKARSQFKTGTDERIEADRKYLAAMQEYYNQRKELDEEYASNSKEINDGLKADVEELESAYKDAVKSRKEDILSQMNLFEAWDSSGYDADTLLYNLKTQVAGLTLWEQQLEELGSKGVSKELMEELKQMGPNAAASIYSLNHMTKEQLAEYEKLWKQKNDLAESQAVKDNDGLLQETNKEISQLRKEAQAELNALNADYRAALAELNTGMSSDLSKLLSQAGKIGEDAVSGLIGGIKKASDSVEVYKSTTKVVNTVSAGLSELKQEGDVIGKGTLDSILEGMLDETKIDIASKKVVQSVKQAMLKNAEDEMLRQQETLQTQMDGINFSGIAAINDALSGYRPGGTVVHVDTGNMAEAVKNLSSDLNRMVETISQLKVVLDTGEVVGVLQPEMSRQTASAVIRQNRGRL